MDGSDDATAEPWAGPTATAELQVDGHAFVLTRETVKSLRDDLETALTESNP